jgi:hypothetical protein
MDDDPLDSMMSETTRMVYGNLIDRTALARYLVWDVSIEGDDTDVEAYIAQRGHRMGGDVHLYSNHLEQARLQLTREPRVLPVMRVNPKVKNIFDFKYEDFALEGYDPHPHIKADVSV